MLFYIIERLVQMNWFHSQRRLNCLISLLHVRAKIFMSIFENVVQLKSIRMVRQLNSRSYSMVGFSVDEMIWH